MKNRFKLVISITLIIIVILAFLFYIKDHKDLITKLFHTPLYTVLIILFLYFLSFAIIGVLLWISVVMCRKTLPIKDNILLTSYSSLVNFFVPGQGGIAVRSIYLKKTQDLLIKKYILASLIYYFFYAVISVIFLLIFNKPILITFSGIFAVSVISLVIIYFYSKKTKLNITNISEHWKSLVYLFLATLVQAIIQAGIFGIELHSVNKQISFHQIITYTGAANFSLFVALTPGAIGIRESFLVLSQKLHGISTVNIVSANLLDRSVFILFMLIIFITTLLFHAKYKMISNQTQPDDTI